jgi:hypothetical protein
MADAASARNLLLIHHIHELLRGHDQMKSSYCYKCCCWSYNIHLSILTTGAGAPSSSGATTTNNAEGEPTTATAAETTEAGARGTSYVVVDDEDDEPIAKKRKLKYDVWLEFDQVKIAGRQKS